MAALPYLRVYCADWDADTSHLTATQDGIYWRLVRNYWQRGKPLPDDDERLARIARVSMRDWMRNRDVIREFFTVEENLWHHPRLSHELACVATKSLNMQRPGNANATRMKRISNANGTQLSIYTDTDTDTEEIQSKEDCMPIGEPTGAPEPLQPEEVFEAYQDLAKALGLPIPRDFTPERRQLVKGRISQYPLDDFKTVFAKCRDSPFLRGDRGHSPLTADWLFKKGNFQKVLEGNYA